MGKGERCLVGQAWFSRGVGRGWVLVGYGWVEVVWGGGLKGVQWAFLGVVNVGYA